MDRHGARIPIHSDEDFDRWFWDHGSMERPGDTRSQRPSALQAEAPAELSPGHSIDSAGGVEGTRGNTPSVGERPAARAERVRPDLSAGRLQAGINPGASGSIDFDWLAPPPPTIVNVAWYRHRAEECGDLAAEMMAEGLDGPAYGAAIRAANYGRIALDLYEQRRQGIDWQVPGHAGNFL